MIHTLPKKQKFVFLLIRSDFFFRALSFIFYQNQKPS